MKTTQYVTLTLVVLLALAVSAHVFASPTAIAYGASVPIVERELKELTPQAAMPGDVSVLTRDAQPVGFRAADNLRVTVFHGLAMKFSATVLNLPNEQTHKVWFGFPGSIDMDAYADWSDRTDIKRKLQDARKADLGRWYLGFPVGGNRWECYVPSDILNVNQTTQVVIKLEGQFNKCKMKILWLITIKSWQGGRYEERLEVACVEAPQGVEGMPREQVFTFLEGFHPAWAAPVMSQPSGMNGPMGPMPTPTPAGGGDYVTPQELGLAFDNFRATNKEDIRAVVREELSTARPAPPAATPKPDVQEQGTTSAPGVPTELAIRIAPDGGYEVLDRENDDGYVVGRHQRVYVILSRPLKPGEAVERNISYIDEQSGTCRWTKAPIPLSQFDEARRATFFYLTDPRVTIGEHALFVRVTGPNGELANTTKTLIVKEDDQ